MSAKGRGSKSSSTLSYGQLVKTPLYEQSPPPLPSISSHTDDHSHLAAPSGQRTLDDVRDQVALSIAIRSIHQAETVDDTKVGVVVTLAPSSDTTFLRRIASKIKHTLLSSSYLFIVSTTAPPGSSAPVLVCGSNARLVHLASILVNAKFLGRISPDATTTASDDQRWLGLVRDLGSTAYDEAALWDIVRKAARNPIDPLTPPPGSLGITEILELARTRLQRITPQMAYDELRDVSSPSPVVLVDIRPEAQRVREGAIGGAWVVERNVLEWRFDPRCEARLAVADRYDLRVIVFCQEGYTSSLAAASLHDLGLLNATDVVGGYKAWKEAGLPEEVEVLANGSRHEDQSV